LSYSYVSKELINTARQAQSQDAVPGPRNYTHTHTPHYHVIILEIESFSTTVESLPGNMAR